MRKATLTILVTMLLVFAAWQNPTPVCTAPGDQENFLALPYADGGVLVLWEDYRNGDADIYAQALDANGNALWQENGGPVIIEAGDQDDLDAVVLDGADVVVAWDDERVSDQHSVYMQRLGPDGILKWDADGVPVHVSQLSITDPHLCLSGDGAILEWKVGDDVLKARRILPNGEVVWPDTGITICAERVGLGEIAPDQSGGMIVSYWKAIWENMKYIGEFRVQRIDSLGAFLWGDSGILVYTDTASSSTVFSKVTERNKVMGTPDGFGGAILQWREPLWRAQRVDSMGNLLWGDSGIIVVAVHAGIAGDCSSLLDNGLYIVRGSPDAHPDEYLHAHRLTLDGETPFGDSGIEVWRVWAADPVYDVEPRVTEEGIIAWRDSWDRGIGDDRYEERGILAQRIDTSGNVLWPQEVLICSTSGYSPRIVSTTDKGAIVVWKDIRNGNMDIYSAHIDSLGNVGAVEKFYPKMESMIRLNVGLNHLTYSVPSQTHLSVYSCTGRLLGEETVSGKGKYIPTGLPAGVYFVQFRDKNQDVTAKLVVVK